jgi:uncharacterized membrane protein YdbT with pleckstrin-like domain
MQAPASASPSTPDTDDTEHTLFEGHPAMVPNLLTLLVTVLTLGLALLYLWVRTRGTHYRITNQRVIIERGLFSKRMDQVDTYRINDYVVERPFGQRIMGTGNIMLSSIDRSNPKVEIIGIKTDVLALYEQLRKATEEQKIRRGVRTLDNTEHAM